jgi:Putative peptidoglycan binding domain
LISQWTLLFFEVHCMFPFMRMKQTILLTAAALLCTSPVAAAIKSKPGATRVKARATAPASQTKAPSNASSRTSSRKSLKVMASPSSSAVSHKGRKGRVQSASTAKAKFHGQQSIDPARTTEIQQALIREQYLDCEATGSWDQATRDALTRFQSDNHWQTKILPDARALIKLGLGPRQEGLLNPESAAIAIPYQGGLGKPSSGGSN